MKKNIIFSLLVLLCVGNALGAALIPQPVIITPQLTASVGAICSFATPSQEALTRIYCVSEISGQEAVCFPYSHWGYNYVRAEKTANLLSWLINFGFGAPDAPTVSCHSIEGRPITSALDCVTTADNVEGEKMCFTDSLHCSLPRPESADAVHCFENQHLWAKYNTGKSLQERSDWDHFFRAYEKHLASCPDDNKSGQSIFDLKTHICPLQDEGLDAYVNRVLANAKIVSMGTSDLPHAHITDRSLFWQLPWHIQRYLLAIAVELDQIDINKPLPISGLTLLEHAAQHGDEDFTFWLWDRNASGKASFSLMLKSKDERSFAVLKVMADAGMVAKGNWRSANAWAADLSPELAVRKMKVLGEEKICKARSIINAMEVSSPGAQAVKDWALARSDIFNCAQCEIL